MVSEDVPYKPMGGLARHALNLANALIVAGHQVDFLGGNQFSYDECKAEMNFQGRFLKGLNIRHMTWREPKLGFFNYYRRDFMARQFAWAIMKHARDYDVVHYHGHIPTVANYISSDINFVQTRHDQGSDCMIHTRFKHNEVCREILPEACAGCAHPTPGPLRTRLSAWAVNKLRRETAQAFANRKTLFVSQCLRDNFQRTLPDANLSRTQVVHNFVDYSRIRDIAAGAEAQASDRLEVLIVGAIYGAKGVGAFLEALSGQHAPHLRVSIIGQGEDLPKLRAQFEGEGVQFLGGKDYHEAIRAAVASDAVVVPSIWEEPCATTVLEGLALGKPVYSLKRGGTPELLVYERYPDQLRLFDSMEDLAESLVKLDIKTPMGLYDEFAGDVRHCVSKIVKIYEQ